MPTWMGNILQTYKVYREDQRNVFEFEIRKLTVECGCMVTYNINQLLGLSGLWSAFSPLRSRDLPLPLCRIFSSPAHMLCWRGLIHGNVRMLVRKWRHNWLFLTQLVDLFSPHSTDIVHGYVYVTLYRHITRQIQLITRKYSYSSNPPTRNAARFIVRKLTVIFIRNFQFV